MTDKKTDQLNIRVTPEMKQALTNEGQKLDWAPTKLAEKILSKWLNEAKEGKTNIKEFIK